MPQYGNLINAHTNKRNLAAEYGLLCGMLYNYNIIKSELSDNDFKGWRFFVLNPIFYRRNNLLLFAKRKNVQCTLNIVLEGVLCCETRIRSFRNIIKSTD